MSTAIEGLHKPSAADLARGNEVQLAVLAGKTPGLREHARDWKMRAVSFVGGLMGLSSILSACASEVRGVGGPNPIQVNPDTNPALATAAAQAEQREATAVAAATAEAKPAEVTPARQGGGKPEETGTKAPEVLPQYKIAEEIGIPSKEPKEGWVKFTREVTEPKGEVLYFDPQSLIGQYAGLDLRTVANGLYIDTLFSVRDGLINRALEAEAAIVGGDIEGGRDKLIALKKRIEFQSRSDKRVEEVAKTGVIWDGNGDGISDYLEPFYKGTQDAITPLLGK